MTKQRMRTSEDKLDVLLREASNNLEEYENFDDYAAQNFESLEDLDDYEVQHLVRRFQAMKTQSAHGKMQLNAKASAQAKMAAQFDITFTRTGANFAVVLEACVFGYSAMQGAYNRMINVPAGLTLTVSGGVFTAQPNFVRFSYTDGVNTDTIDVTCKQLPYPELLFSMATAHFRLSKIRYKISDILQQTQKDNRFQKITRTTFGTYNEEDIPLGSQEKPTDFKTNLIDIPAIVEMNKYNSIVHGINPSNGFAVTLGVFVEKFGR